MSTGREAGQEKVHPSWDALVCYAVDLRINVINLY